MNECTAGDKIDQQRKCKFFEIQYGCNCMEQRFGEYCISDKAKLEIHDDKDISDRPRTEGISLGFNAGS
jgi:hypothetical protein